MDLKREQSKALKKARQYAKSGNCHMAQQFVNRAAQFWPVSKRSLTSLNKVIKECKRR